MDTFKPFQGASEFPWLNPEKKDAPAVGTILPVTPPPLARSLTLLSPQSSPQSSLNFVPPSPMAPPIASYQPSSTSPPYDVMTPPVPRTPPPMALKEGMIPPFFTPPQNHAINHPPATPQPIPPKLPEYALNADMPTSQQASSFMTIASSDREPPVVVKTAHSTPTTKVFLNAGCGGKQSSPVHPMFRSQEWHQIRLDASTEVSPDILAELTNMYGVASNSVDAVYSSHSLEHLYPHEIPRAISEFFRVLKPGGFVLINTPNLKSASELVVRDRLEEPAYHSPAGPISALDMIYGHKPTILFSGEKYNAHHMGFTAKTLKQTLQRGGFVDVETNCSGFHLWALGYKRVGEGTIPNTDLSQPAPANREETADPSLSSSLYDALLYEMRALLEQQELSSQQRWKLLLQQVAQGEIRLMIDALLKQHGSTVQNGLFAGMRLMFNGEGHGFLPKLLGSYEQELHPLLHQLQTQFAYQRILILRAQDGFYPVGLAKVFPSAQITVIENNAMSIQRTVELGKMNQIVNRISFLQTAEPYDIDTLLASSRETLIFSDCSDCPLEFWNPEQIAALKLADLLVRLPQIKSVDALKATVQPFQSSHKDQVIGVGARSPYTIRSIAGWSQLNQNLAITEFQQVPPAWLWLKHQG